MAENWDAALDAATGFYVTLINDKTILREDALQKMTYVLEKTSAAFVTWVIGMGESFEDVGKESKLPRYHVVKNAEVIESALSGRIDLYQRLAPRGTNCMMTLEYLRLLREKYGTLCRPVSPDYSLSIFMLEESDFSQHIYEVLGGVVKGSPSNTEDVKRTSHMGGCYSTLGFPEGGFFFGCSSQGLSD